MSSKIQYKLFVPNVVSLKGFPKSVIKNKKLEISVIIKQELATYGQVIQVYKTKEECCVEFQDEESVDRLMAATDDGRGGNTLIICGYSVEVSVVDSDQDVFEGQLTDYQRLIVQNIDDYLLVWLNS